MATLREKLAALTLTEEEIRALLTSLTDGYEQYAEQEQLPTLSYLLSSFGSYLATEEAQGLITKTVAASVDTSALQNSVSQYSEVISQQMGAVMQKIFASAGTQIASMLQSNMAQLTSGLSENLLSGFSFNTDALADVFKTQMTAEELKDLMTSLFSSEKTTYDSNLKKLGYAEPAKPSAITIYPLDFDSKNRVKDIIGAYNAQMEAAGNEEKIIEYTDLVDALMGSVTTIIDAISYILIAFVAISLIVSSIMIGVITYISVLERRKEIGILRAIGASKHNISTVFNAETFIIGALAGVIGIVISELIILIANPILHSLTGRADLDRAQRDPHPDRRHHPVAQGGKERPRYGAAFRIRIKMTGSHRAGLVFSIKEISFRQAITVIKRSEATLPSTFQIPHSKLKSAAFNTSVCRSACRRKGFLVPVEELRVVVDEVLLVGGADGELLRVHMEPALVGLADAPRVLAHTVVGAQTVDLVGLVTAAVVEVAEHGGVMESKIARLSVVTSKSRSSAITGRVRVLNCE